MPVKTRRRVALVALHFSEYSVHLALALAKHCDVLLILYADNAQGELGPLWRNSINDSSITLIAIDRPAGVLSIIGNARQIVSQVRRFNPDIVHCQEELRDELALSLFWLRKWPIVLTIHDPSPHTGADLKRFRFSRFRIYRPWVRYCADAAVTHGRFLVEAVSSTSPRLKNKVYSLPHGPLGIFHADNSETRPQPIRLLFFGRIHAYKGLRYFVDAVIALRDSGYPVTGVVAGRGGDLANYRERMERAGCFEILDWRIPAVDVPNLFVSSTVVIVPYIDGTQSGVAAMALGFGRPVVATAVGSIPELVRDGENGLLVPAADAVALAAAIKLIISDTAMWEKLASGARTLRNGELSWARVAEETVAAYESVLHPPA